MTGLPWARVNEESPARVADVLELSPSPRGPRKRMCPFCGGRNLAPLKRVFFCYSGCGGRAYSNVDTAARCWGLTPAEACRRLAGLLAIPCGADEPPWRELAARTCAAAAAALELRAAAEARRWDCPVCGGAGTLRAFRRRWRCGGAACVGDARRGWKGHADLAAAVWRTTRVDACFRLDAALRGEVRGPRPSAARATPPEEPSARETALAAVRARPGACEPEALYRLLLGHLRLGPMGREELLRRRIDPRRAERYGFRSTEPGEWERRVLPLMAAFADDELAAAGFPRADPPEEARSRHPPRPWWPGWGRAPLLLIPVRDGRRVAGLRFRNLGDPARTRCPRYASPRDAGPEVPFHAAALERAGSTLHVVEGELNAFVLSGDPYRAAAVGIPGAWTWRDAWTLRIPEEVRWVVGWFDADKAGREGAARVGASLARVRGPGWAGPRWRVLLLEQDACELHRAGRLADLLGRAPWTTLPEALRRDVGARAALPAG